MKTTEVKVPDIGDYKDVPVIEVLVKEGDQVEKDAPLAVLESDKATMEVPSPEAGTVRGVKIKAGDKVSRGDVICALETATAAAPPPAAAQAAPEKKPEASPAPVAQLLKPNLEEYVDTNAAPARAVDRGIWRCRVTDTLRPFPQFPHMVCPPPWRSPARPHSRAASRPPPPPPPPAGSRHPA